MYPNRFSVSQSGFITVQSAFTENVFRPEIAVDSADFHVVSPDGERKEFEHKTAHRQLVILEEELTADGTYRLTTGVRLGRKGRRMLVDGEWKPLFPSDAPVPDEALQVATTQTETVADVYVTKGAPSWGAVKAPIGRLVFMPVTHPNKIYLDETFEMDVVFDGAPLADKALTITREGGCFEEPEYKCFVKTGADGRLTAVFDKPGVYMIYTRHRACAPDGAETDERSYTTSLTFEVIR